MPIRRRSSVQAVLTAAALACAMAVAQAQEVRSRFDLPAQSLADSLRAVASQMHVNVLFDPPLVAAFRAPALRGELTAAQAFAFLLAGTGMQHEFIDERTVVILRTRSEGGRPAARSIAEDCERLRGESDMPRTCTSRKNGIIGFLASVFGASGAPAQEPSPPADAGRLDEVVVTAQKREQALKDVPLAIQAFSGESLEREGIKSAADILAQVPSASFATYTPTGSILQLRGISQNAAVDPSVAFYVDEVPFGLPGAPTAPNVDALDLERIEVLRGPQGTLYGLGAMGGTVRVITADPNLTEGFAGRVSVDGSAMQGGDESYLGSLALNLPLVEDKLAARVSLSYRHDGGWVDDVGRGTKNVNSGDVFSVRGKLLYSPTDRLKIKLSVWRSETDTDWSNQAFFKNTTDKTATGSASDPEAFLNTHFTIYSGFVSYDLGFATLEDGLSYYESEIPGRFVIGTPPPPFGLGLLTVDTVDDSDAITNELRLVSPGDRSLQWIAGIFYRDISREFFQVGGFEFFPSFIPPSDAKIDSRSISYFGEVSYGFADDLVRILAGARYFEDRRDYKERVVGFPPFDLSPKFTSFNPRVNVTVKPADGFLVYLNAAKGFRSGVINTTAQTLSAALDGIFGIQVVEPDEIWTYEVGTKMSFLDRKLYLEAALYHSDWNDFQLQATSSTGFTFNVNGGDARIRGIEGSISWFTPVNGLSAALNASYTDAEFEKVSSIVSAKSPLFVQGARLPTVPEWSGNVSVNYDAPLSSTGLNLVAGGMYTFRGGQIDASGLPGIFTDARDELSLRAGVRNDRWELTAYMNNVTNNIDSVGSLTVTQWYSPLPRTTGLRFTVNF